VRLHVFYDAERFSKTMDDLGERLNNAAEADELMAVNQK